MNRWRMRGAAALAAIALAVAGCDQQPTDLPDDVPTSPDTDQTAPASPTDGATTSPDLDASPSPTSS